MTRTVRMISALVVSALLYAPVAFATFSQAAQMIA